MKHVYSDDMGIHLLTIHPLTNNSVSERYENVKRKPHQFTRAEALLCQVYYRSYLVLQQIGDLILISQQSEFFTSAGCSISS